LRAAGFDSAMKIGDAFPGRPHLTTGNTVKVAQLSPAVYGAISHHHR
jgi:hypothetical protein